MHDVTRTPRVSLFAITVSALVLALARWRVSPISNSPDAQIRTRTRRRVEIKKEAPEGLEASNPTRSRTIGHE